MTYKTDLQSNNIDLQSILDTINTLPEAGVQLPTLTNEGSASDLLSGKQLIDSDGNVVTGTIASKTSSNLTVSGRTVTVPAGYYASNASKSVSTATQATPSISISEGGLITASATQSAGYVASGTKSSTKQMTIKSIATITPTTSNQTIASGTYIIGTQTIKGDANLVASNIKKGVSIFGVTGTCSPVEYVAVTFNSALLSRINALSYTSVESGVVTAHYHADSTIPTTAFTALIVKGSVISVMADYSANVNSFKGTGDVSMVLADSNWYMVHFVANGAGNCTYS